MQADETAKEQPPFQPEDMDDERLIVFIKELSERDRPYMVNHFKALSFEDRILRFGRPMTDEAITRYVDNMDFERDTMFGVYESAFNLVGVGHLGFPPPEQLPGISDGENNETVAEFGVSVLAPARRLNVGTKLFDRAALHCRNKSIDTLYIHCLASNKPMLCIAHKAGMEIHRDHGEVDGYLKLPAGDLDSRRYEAVEERAATVNIALDWKFKNLIDWLRTQLLPKDDTNNQR